MKQTILSNRRFWILFGVIATFLFAYSITLRSAQAAGPFVTTWKTDQNSATDASVTIPTANTETYNYFVDWGDGNTDSNVTGTIGHTYDSPGTYQISISGQFPRILFKVSDDKHKIQSVDAWGSIQWSSMVDAFAGAKNLSIAASDSPDLSNVDSLSGMFKDATSMNSPIGHWNLANVSSIANMFEGATSFNQDLSSWNTSNIQMFAFAFRDAKAFNQNLNAWDVGSAVSTNGMFAGADTFNQPVSTWIMPLLRDMRNMFHNAVAFDQDVSNWDTSTVERMENAFRNAVNFRQDISSWDFGPLKNADNMFSGTRLSGVNYDKLLVALSEADVNSGITLHAGLSTYCEAEIARNVLVNDKGWTIIDNGRDTSSCAEQDIQFENGVAATVNENAPVPTTIDNLITIPSNNQSNFTYEFCGDPQLDREFFQINGNTLVATTSFDFENPLDENGDNVYEFCIRSSGPGGFDLQRVLSVAVIDDANEENPDEDGDGNGDGSNSDDGSDPQVLASSTDGNSDVLAAEDEDSGKVLAASGVAIVTGIATGLAIVFITSYFSRKTLAAEPVETNNTPQNPFQY